MNDASSASSQDGPKGLFDFLAPGTRRPMDWKYSTRRYLMLGLVPIFFLGAGWDLLAKESWWQPIAGIVMYALMVAVLGLYVRWLLRPVDPVAKAELEEYYESMRWETIWREGRELVADIRTTFSDWRNRRRSRS